jgi:catechol 2,3-dioxygenase-like lactoylglutathione lyase family enzyme
MPHVLGIDHVAFAAADLEATSAFYDSLFGTRTHRTRPETFGL